MFIILYIVSYSHYFLHSAVILLHITKTKGKIKRQNYFKALLRILKFRTFVHTLCLTEQTHCLSHNNITEMSFVLKSNELFVIRKFILLILSKISYKEEKLKRKINKN
jgi:hypothetical protein